MKLRSDNLTNRKPISKVNDVPEGINSLSQESVSLLDDATFTTKIGS